MPRQPHRDAADAAIFRERRRVPWWWWLIACAVALPSVEVVTVFAPDMTSHGSWVTAVVAAAVTIAVIGAGLAALSRSDVVVDANGLRADGATLAPGAIGRVRALDRESTRLVLGRDARADARLSIRPWVHTAVQIEVDDPADPAPYWVVGSRRPEELAAALSALSSALRDRGKGHVERHVEGHVATYRDHTHPEGGRQ